MFAIAVMINFNVSVRDYTYSSFFKFQRDKGTAEIPKLDGFEKQNMGKNLHVTHSSRCYIE